ncbi:hypothetical protein PFI31113_03641 [Pandoraea fibrosis]|uniref:Uncharacterized protein n=1 Tax=Pandoraea fibrosis TaxID=1891094 RepID=A0A5E4X5W6_9BURK|nr:hypothetical protein PFI31113_03641 [Pandoraea fibrosis]
MIQCGAVVDVQTNRALRREDGRVGNVAQDIGLGVGRDVTAEFVVVAIVGNAIAATEDARAFVDSTGDGAPRLIDYRRADMHRWVEIGPELNDPVTLAVVVNGLEMLNGALGDGAGVVFSRVADSVVHLDDGFFQRERIGVDIERRQPVFRNRDANGTAHRI